MLARERQPTDVDAAVPAAAALPRAVIVAAAAELALAISRAGIGTNVDSWGSSNTLISYPIVR